MKKRKSPIILISVILICGIVVAIMNQPPADPTKEKETADPIQGTSTTMPSPQQLAQTEQSTASSKSTPSPAPASKKTRGAVPMEGMPLGSNGPRTDASESHTAPKPMPTDNSISNQWYTPESHTAGK